MRREGENRDDKDDQDHQPKHETLALVMIPGSFRATADGPLLSVEVPGEDRRVFPLTRNLTVIGRSANADVILSDPAISDYHARIIKHPFGYTVEDMGSAAGTLLHDRPVNHARLVNGDVLRLGTIQVTFVDEQTGSQRKAPKNVTALVASPSIGRQLKTRPRFAKADEQDSEDLRSRLPKSSEDAEPSFEDMLRKILLAARYLRRHVRLISTLAVLGIGLGAASFKLLPPGQPAKCVVTLHPAPKPNPLSGESNYPRSRADEMSFFLGADVALVNTSTILATLHQMGEVHAWEGEAQKIAKRMKVEALGSTGASTTIALTLTPKMFDPRHDWYLQFLDTHVKSYLEAEIAKKLQVFVAEVDFLASQTAAADKRIREIREETVKYHEAHSEQILMQSALASSPGDLESRRIALQSEISRLQGELEGVLSQLARGSALSQARVQFQQSDREALAALDRKLTELRAQGFADGHPDVERILSQKKVMQKTMEVHLRAGPTQLEKRSNLNYDSLQGQADQLQAKLRAARSELGFITANRRSLREVSSEAPKVNAHIEELNRQKDEAVRQYALLSDRLNTAEVHLQLERVSAASRYEIVQPARFDWPAGRKVFLTRLGIGLGIGLFLAALVLGIGELRRAFARAARGLPATMLLLALTGLMGCAHDGKYVWAADLPLKDEKVEPIVAPGDTLTVEVQRQPTLSGEFLVREDGHYTQPVAGSIEAANKSPRQIAAALTAALRGVVIDPVVSVWISKTTPIKISIVGEVKAPGSYELTRDRSLLSALARAGWVTEFAHLDRVFVVRVGSSERIRFRLQDITTAEPWAAQFQLSDSDAVVVE